MALAQHSQRAARRLIGHSSHSSIAIAAQVSTTLLPWFMLRTSRFGILDVATQYQLQTAALEI